MQRRVFIIFGFLTLSGLAAMGAQWNNRVWHSDDVLLDKKVVGVQQSSDGFLWVATARGVMRFDGLEFEVIPVTAEFGASGKIDNLFIDSLDRLWITQQRGEILCVEKGSVTLKIPSQSNRMVVSYPSFVEESPGRILVCYPEYQLFRVFDGKVERVTEGEEIANGNGSLVKDGLGRIWFSQGHQGFGVIKEGRFCVLETIRVDLLGGARAGGVWICSGNELWRYTDVGRLEQICKLPQELGQIQLTALFEDSRGDLWLGSDGAGLFCFDGLSFTQQRCSHPRIASIDEDRDGNIWVGTLDGLNLFTPETVKFLRSDNSLSYESPFSIAQETNGSFWVVWSSGLISKSVSTDLWGAPDSGAWWGSDANAITQAQCVVRDPAGGLWFGTEKSGLYRWKDGAVVAHLGLENGLATENVIALHTSPEGDVWIGTKNAGPLFKFYLQVLRSGVLQSYALPPASRSVVAFASDAEGRCWVATYDGRLLSISRDGEMKDHTAQLFPAQYGILSLCASPDRSLWIGFSGQGVGRLKDGRFSLYRTENGLHQDFISRILCDRFGRLWFAGKKGIARVAIQDFDEVDAGRAQRVQSVVYGKSEGLLNSKSTDFFWPGAICDDAGRLLFCMKGGLAVMRPEAAGERQAPPLVAIERVSVDGKTVAQYNSEAENSGSAQPKPLELSGQGEKRLRIPPGANHVEIAFTAPCFRLPESTVFRCRLQGQGSHWDELGHQRSVSYYGIKPGNYLFQVVARNSDGAWSEKGATFSLTLEPYWWETVWFRVGGPLVAMGGLVIGIVFFLRRRQKIQIERLELQQATEKERARIAADLHDEMGASLAQIAILSNLVKREGNVDSLQSDQLSQIKLRAQENVRKLAEIVWAVNPARDSLEHLASYLCKFAEEYLALQDVRFRADIPDELPSVCLDSATRHHVYLATKEAIHNAVRHGHPSTLTLSISIEGETFVVSVCDDGCGFDGDAALACGRGVSNMKSRLSQIGGELRIDRVSGGGSNVLFYVPFKKRRK
jgi:signal transduction histidine kinase/ligand-binding sensor domain-containing protein